MSFDNKFRGLLLGVLIILALGVASNFSVFKSLNDAGNDMFMRLFPSSAPVSDKLIIVDAGQEFAGRGDEVWMPLLHGLLDHGAAQVVFTFLPRQASEAFYQFAVKSGKVLFGRRLQTDAESGENMLEPLPPGAANKKLLLGLLRTPPNDDGVYRRQYSVVDYDGAVFPSLEKLAAEKIPGAAKKVPEPVYNVNFNGGSARLPKIGLERILAGGLISELVFGRTVLVGAQGSSPLAYYLAPVAAKKSLISDVLFHGFALDTLLSDRIIGTTPQWLNWILIAGMTLLSLFMSQWLAGRNGFWFAVGLSVASLLVAALSLQLFSLALPLAELLLAQWLSGLSVWRYRLVAENTALHTMLVEVAGNVHDKIFPDSVYHLEDVWQPFADMVSQTLQLEKMVFLERAEDSYSLREIKAYNCTFKDIEEKRRDFRRQPYSLAITENRPVLLQHAYLRTAADPVKTEQFLAPLMHAGEVLGAWCFVPKSGVEATASQARTLTLAHEYMRQMSEILHCRQNYQQRWKGRQQQLRGYLRLAGGILPSQLLYRPLLLVERRIASLQEVFNHHNSGSIIYDIFGRVLLVNKPMEVLAQKHNLKPYNMSMLEFITTLTGIKAFEVQRILQQIIFDREKLTLPVASPDKTSSWVLHIKPLHHEAVPTSHSMSLDESFYFGLSGILCELVNISQLQEMSELKVLMCERFNYQLRNEMTEMLCGLSALNDGNVSDDDKRSALRLVQNKIGDALMALQTVQDHLHLEVEDLSANSLICYPVDGCTPLQNILGACREQALAHHLNVHVSIPESMRLVFASPRDLESVLAVLLRRMMEDAFEAGDIWIDVAEAEKRVLYRIRNNGPGMPENDLQQWLHNAGPDALQGLKLEHALNCIKHWGGTINFTSTLGEGSTLELSLRSFT